jgi:hypothetical protein
LKGRVLMTIWGRTRLPLGLVAASAVFVLGCAGGVDDTPEAIGASRSSALTATIPASDCDGDEREPTRTVATSGSTGHVEIEDFFIGGVFFADDTILRAKGHPECVAHIESPDEAFAAAGMLTVSSDAVGTPGGPPAPFAINPDGRNEYFEFPDPPLFNVGEGTKVQVALAGAPGFPPIPETALRSSASGPINVTEPVVPGSGVLAVSSTAPLRFAWDVPATQPPRGDRGRHQQHVSMRLFALGPVGWGQLYCSWPTAAGRGNVPASLLGAFRGRLGGTGAVDAVVDMYSGEFRELATAKSSYVVFVTTDDATTLPRSTSATFE